MSAMNLDSAMWAWLEGSALGRLHTVEQLRDRPWSRVWYVAGAGGAGYFKAPGPGGRQEAPLLRWLAGRFAGHLPPIIRLDEARGWSLTAPAGSLLRQLPDAGAQHAILQQFLPIYANLQRASIPVVADLAVLGLPDRQPARLPQLLAELLASPHGQALPGELRARCRAALPRLAEVCAWLAAAPYAIALEHGDLHTNNMLLSDGQIRLCDWGDANLSHPFFSLLPTFENLFPGLPAEVDDPLALALRDAYLAPWRDLAPTAQLKVQFQQALRTGYLLRTLDIAHQLAGASEAELARWRPFITDWLARWLDSEAGSNYP
jgi:hypothetical protein